MFWRRWIATCVAPAETVVALERGAPNRSNRGHAVGGDASRDCRRWIGRGANPMRRIATRVAPARKHRARGGASERRKLAITALDRPRCRSRRRIATCVSCRAEHSVAPTREGAAYPHAGGHCVAPAQEVPPSAQRSIGAGITGMSAFMVTLCAAEPSSSSPMVLWPREPITITSASTCFGDVEDTRREGGPERTHAGEHALHVELGVGFGEDVDAMAQQGLAFLCRQADLRPSLFAEELLVRAGCSMAGSR